MDDKRERGPRVVVVNGEGFASSEPRRETQREPLRDPQREPQRDPQRDPQRERTREQPDEFDETPVQLVTAAPLRRPGEHAEEVQRVHVEEEDRLAFRVGVNILTLVLIGLAAYVVWRNFFQ